MLSNSMVETTRIPKVSVCVITYNHERFIGECLQSIIDQKTNFDFEVIVGDDCSNDGTRDVIRDLERRYPGKIRPVFQEQNIGGGCNNYRVVHRLARGAYIAHMDGDDMMEPGKLQLQSDFLDQYTECSMVAHGAFYLGLDGRKSVRVAKHRSAIAGINELLEHQCYFTHSSKMYRSSIRDKSWALNQNIFIDFELHIECAGEGSIGYIDMPLVTYRETENSITSGPAKKIFELFQYTLRGYDLAIKNGASAEKAMHEKCIYIYKTAVFFVQRGAVEFAGKCFDVFDEIPVRMRPAFYAVLLCGNFKRVRILVCKVIAFVRSRLN